MAAEKIYLDHNATTPLDPRVGEAMLRAGRDAVGNPASQHFAGRQARRMLEEAREGIAELLGARTGGMDADRVIFTSGGTEANNLALLGLAAAAEYGPAPIVPTADRGQVLVSQIEHPSVRGAAEELQRRGFRVQKVAPDSDGLVTAEAIGDALQGADEAPGKTLLLSLMLANNETGVVQPVAEAAAICGPADVLVHTDAVQAVGKIPVHFRELSVNAMTVAPHKFHGPLGVGALIVRHGVPLAPQLFGGFQQGGLRPGTESVVLAVGFHEALRLAVGELAERTRRMASLRNDLEARIRQGWPNVVVIGQDAPRLPNTSCLAFPGLERQALVMALDLAGVACSTGSACASGSSEPSPPLVAMRLPSPVIEGAIRLSLGATTSPRDIAQAADRILLAANNLRRAE